MSWIRLQKNNIRKKSNFCVALHSSSLQRTISTSHSSEFARLEFGAFYFAITIRLFTKPSIFHYTITFYLNSASLVSSGFTRHQSCGPAGGIIMQIYFFRKKLMRILGFNVKRG